MEASKLPADVLVTALASRLADLQCARIESDDGQFVTPAPQTGAERRALVARHLLVELEQRLLVGSTDLAAIDLLCASLQDAIPGVTPEEVRFSARFLAADRSIQYLEDSAGSPRETRSWTSLVVYQVRTDRARLSKAGRVFLQVLRHRGDWLYEDKHVEKLIRAIQSSLFDDLPRLAAEITSTLRMFNEEITTMRESSTFVEMATAYDTRRTHITDMLQRVQQAALDASALMRTPVTQNNFKAFRDARPDAGLSLPGLRNALQTVHQVSESLNRNWAGLLEDLQYSDRQRLGIVRFDRIIQSFVESPPSLGEMEGLLTGCCGWIAESQIVSCTAIVDSIEDDLEPPPAESVVFDDDPALGEYRDPLTSWLHQNIRAIAARLREGPMLLSRILEDSGLPEAPLESARDVASLLGIYVSEDPFGQRIKVQVGLASSLLQIDQLGYRIRASDLSIRLLGQEASQ